MLVSDDDENDENEGEAAAAAAATQPATTTPGPGTPVVYGSGNDVDSMESSTPGSTTNKSLGGGAIAGIIIGVLVVIGAVVALVLCCQQGSAGAQPRSSTNSDNDSITKSDPNRTTIENQAYEFTATTGSDNAAAAPASNATANSDEVYDNVDEETPSNAVTNVIGAWNDNSGTSQAVYDTAAATQDLQNVQSTNEALPSVPQAAPSAPAVVLPPVASHPTCKALHPYTASADNQISMARGEVLTIVDDSGEWWRVRNASGQEGLVPSNFVAKQETIVPPGPTHGSSEA